VVYVPALYPATPAQADDDALRLGRATAWSEEAGPVRGGGLKMFLFDDDDLGVLELDEVLVDDPAAAPP
jgi:protein involved in temperature-dependent protein secretion